MTGAASAAVAHLPKTSPCIAFRDGTLHTLFVTNGYFSYCCVCHIEPVCPLSSEFHISKTFFICGAPSRSAVS